MHRLRKMLLPSRATRDVRAPHPTRWAGRAAATVTVAASVLFAGALPASTDDEPLSTY